MISVEGGWPVP